MIFPEVAHSRAAARAAVLTMFLLLPWSLPAAAQTTDSTILETTTDCAAGSCEETTMVPVEGTAMRCQVFASVPDTAYAVRCIDLFMGWVSADARVNGFSGFLVCKNIKEVRCPEIAPIVVKGRTEPLSTKDKLTCTIIGSYFEENLKFDCKQ